MIGYFRNNIVLVALGFGVLALWPVSKPPYYGEATVIDGDTLIVAGVRHRLYGVDAMEIGQTCKTADGRDWPCGQEAADALRRFVAGKLVGCRMRDQDTYGRLISQCWMAADDLSGWIAEAGFAVADPKAVFSYVSDEGSARMQWRGIWAGTFVKPAEWRRAHPGQTGTIGE